MQKNKEEKQRTTRQNRALHKFFELLAIELNTLGLDMKIILKPSYQLWWTKTSIKEHLWRPLQIAMFNKNSTTDLTTKELDKVLEQLQKIIGEKHSVSIDFPSAERLIDYEKDL